MAEKVIIGNCEQKPKLNISFSGGRTSGYMTKLLLDNWSNHYDFIVTFANTGLEHPKTLEFVHNCDVHFGFNTVWLEGIVHHGTRESTTHRVVSYATACRDGSVFEDFIKKYGIPNTAFLGCTRELKRNVMESYLLSLGHGRSGIPLAIGIRADEQRRVSVKALDRKIIYPLIDTWPTDKQDVLDWWEDQPFDLGIDEFEGNCLGCYKKSFRKLFMQIERDPSVFDFHRRMEQLYRNVGPQQGERVFFRKNTDTVGLFKLYDEAAGNFNRQSDLYADGGCSESCEVFETEVGAGDTAVQGDMLLPANA